MLSNYVISVIRTVVPLAVGWVVARLVMAGVDVSSESLEMALVSVLSGAWYALARALELKFPWAGVLLGYKTAPTYTQSSPPA